MSESKQITLTLDKARSMYGKSTEMDDLLLANFTKEELTKKELPKSWNELRICEGYKIVHEYGIASINELPVLMNSTYNNLAIFNTKPQAQSALAMAQLSQLMAVYNDGWVADWANQEQKKYCVLRRFNKIYSDVYFTSYQFLSFKTIALRDQFLANFEPLIKQYLMID